MSLHYYIRCFLYVMFLLPKVLSASEKDTMIDYFKIHPEKGVIEKQYEVLSTHAKTKNMLNVISGRWPHNNEQEIYKSDNLKINQDGSITLLAQGENRQLCGSQPCSARVNTEGHWSFGRNSLKGAVEIVATVPDTKGWWPAIWFLPVGLEWPQGAEIDIVEVTGKGLDAKPTLSKIISTIHYGDNVSNHYWTGNGDEGFGVDGPTPKILDISHKSQHYGFSWDCDFNGVCDLTWFLNGKPYYQIQINNHEELWLGEKGIKQIVPMDGYHHPAGNPYDYSNGEKARKSLKRGFKKGYYLVLNIAAGGDLADGLPGKADKTSMHVSSIKLFDIK